MSEKKEELSALEKIGFFVVLSVALAVLGFTFTAGAHLYAWLFLS